MTDDRTILTYSPGRHFVAVLIFTILWNGFYWGLVFPDIYKSGGNGAYVPMVVTAIFPILGVLFLLGALQLLLQSIKFGVSKLHLRHAPIAIASDLEAELIISKSFAKRYDGQTHFSVRLICIEHLDKDSHHRRRYDDYTVPAGMPEGFKLKAVPGLKAREDHIIWMDEIEIGGQIIRQRQSCKVIVPIRFSIPADLPHSQSFDRREDHAIKWALYVAADIKGADYQSDFIVPVKAAGDRS